MKNLKSIATYVVAGIFAEDEKLAKQRIAMILERKNCLAVFAEGVPVGAKITDEEGLTKYISKRTNKKEVNNLSVEIDNDFGVRVRYSYLYRTVFSKDKALAEKISNGYSTCGEDLKNEKTEEYQYAAKVRSTDSMSVGLNEETSKFLEVEYL